MLLAARSASAISDAPRFTCVRQALEPNPVVTVALNPQQELKCARNLLRFAEIYSAAILVFCGFQKIM